MTGERLVDAEREVESVAERPAGVRRLAEAALEIGRRTLEPGQEARCPVLIAAHGRPAHLEHLAFELEYFVCEHWVEENDVSARKAVAEGIAEEIDEQKRLSVLDIEARVRVDGVVNAPLAPATNSALAGDHGHGESVGECELVVMVVAKIHSIDANCDYRGWVVMTVVDVGGGVVIVVLVEICLKVSFDTDEDDQKE